MNIPLKKIHTLKQALLVLLLSAFLLFEVFSQAEQLTAPSVPVTQLNVNKGDNVQLFFDGFYMTSGGKDLMNGQFSAAVPDSFHEDNVVFYFPITYFYEGEKKEDLYEVVFSGVKVHQEIVSTAETAFKNRSAHLFEAGTVIGQAIEDIVFVSVRRLWLDPNLVSLAYTLPLQNKRYWYYGTDLFSNRNTKWLTFQPIESDTDEIALFPESGFNLKKLSSSPNEKDGYTVEVFSFPTVQIMLQTTLDEYPKLIDAEDSFIELDARTRKNFVRCTHEQTLQLGESTLNLYYQEGFDKYLQNEYTLGDPIYLYVQIGDAHDGKLISYVRDFSLESPDKIAEIKMQQVTEQTEAISTENNEIVSMDWLIFPEGGTKEVERFFVHTAPYGTQGAEATLTENVNNIRELWYDKEGKKILDAFWETGTQLHRNRKLYSYDEEGRISHFESYTAVTETINGKRQPNQHKWRLFYKVEHTYETVADMTVHTETEYRYSYKPFTERLDGVRVFYTDSNDVVRKVTYNAEEGNSFDYWEYDEKGNPTIVRFDNGDYAKDITIQNEYNEDGQLVKSTETDADGIVAYKNYENDPNGKIFTITTKTNVQTYISDSQERLILFSDTDIATGKVLFRRQYRYSDTTGRQILFLEEDFSLAEDYYRFWLIDSPNRQEWQNVETIDVYSLIEELPVE